MERCPNCDGGELQIISAILKRSVIEKIQPTWASIRSRRPEAGRARRGKLEAA